MSLEVKPIHHRLAAAQPLTDLAFASAFARMQRSAEPVTLEGLAGTVAPGDAGPPSAFAWADAEGLLPDLVQEVLDASMSMAFRDVAAEAGVAVPAIDLQSILDPNDPWIDPVVLGETLARRSSEICTVMIDGEEAGTGFLVRPNVVATACHVVQPLLEKTPAGVAAAANSVNRLECVFDNVIVEVQGVRQRRRLNRIPPDRDWLLSISECHPRERQNAFPDDPAQFKGMFDFALIRLATIVGIGLEGLPVEQVARLGSDDTQITILHHPGRKALKYGRGKADRVDGPAYRVWHAVNTEKGSSGAPCLNDSLRVVGMHQAGLMNGPHGLAAGSPANRNRSVPIHWSLAEINRVPMADPGLMPLARLSSGQPVFGRSAVNQWVFNSVAGNRMEPNLAVVAEPGTPGKSFTGELLAALLPPAEHQVVAIETQAFEGLSTEEAVRLLWARLDLPAAALPGFDRLSTASAHLKNVVVEGFVTALAGSPGDGGAPRRHAWIVLDDYDTRLLDAREGGTRDLLNLLLLRAGGDTRLHFALTGYQDAHEVPEVRRRLVVESLGRPTRAEMETFLRMNGLTTRDEKLLGIIFGAVNFTVQSLPFDRDYYRTLAETLEVAP